MLWSLGCLYCSFGCCCGGENDADKGDGGHHTAISSFASLCCSRHQGSVVGSRRRCLSTPLPMGAASCIAFAIALCRWVAAGLRVGVPSRASFPLDASPVPVEPQGVTSRTDVRQDSPLRISVLVRAGRCSRVEVPHKKDLCIMPRRSIRVDDSTHVQRTYCRHRANSNHDLAQVRTTKKGARPAGFEPARVSPLP